MPKTRTRQVKLRCRAKVPVAVRGRLPFIRHGLTARGPTVPMRSLGHGPETSASADHRIKMQQTGSSKAEQSSFRPSLCLFPRLQNGVSGFGRTSNGNSDVDRSTVELSFSVDAERRSLESVTDPLSTGYIRFNGIMHFTNLTVLTPPFTFQLFWTAFTARRPVRRSLRAARRRHFQGIA